MSHLNLSCHNLRSFLPVLSAMVTKNRLTYDNKISSDLIPSPKPINQKKKILNHLVYFSIVIYFLIYADLLQSRLGFK